MNNNHRIFQWVLFLVIISIVASYGFSQRTTLTKDEAANSLYQRLHTLSKIKVLNAPKTSPTVRTSYNQGTPGKNYVPGEVIVRYWDNVSKTRTANVATAHGLSIKKNSKHMNSQLLKVPGSRSITDVVAELQKDPNVKFAEPNYICYASFFPNDPYFNDTTYVINGVGYDPNFVLWLVQYDDILNNNIFFINTYMPYSLFGMDLSDINEKLSNDSTILYSQGVWSFEQGNSNTKIAVLDTGVDLNHEDLQGKILAGWDYVDNDSIPQDQNGHGTHVSGIITANGNNGKGVIGIAPKVKIVPIRVLNAQGAGTDFDLAEGLMGVANDFHADIINMSLGFPPVPTPYQPQLTYEALKEVKKQGVHIVCAAGNDGLNYNTVGNVNWSYPAMFSGVISVGSWDYIYTKVAPILPVKIGYSNYGNMGIDTSYQFSGTTTIYFNSPDGEFDGDIRGTDIFAPGGNAYNASDYTGPIVSTWLSSYIINTVQSLHYQQEQGTSMASPQVAGLVAMMMNHHGIQDRRTMLYALYSTSYNPYLFSSSVITSLGTYTTIGNVTVYQGINGYGVYSTDWGYGMIDPNYAIRAYVPTINLAYSSNSVTDNPSIFGLSGNSNAILDPGETVDLYLTVSNTGLNSANNVVATLATIDPKVTIINNFANYPAILPGLGAAGLTPYRISLSNFTSASVYTIRFLLNMTFSSGTGVYMTQSLPVDLQVGKPNNYVNVGSLYHQIDFTNGTGDYSGLIDDNNTNDRINSLLPRRTTVEPDGTLTGNNVDGYFNTGENVEMRPTLLNNLDVNLYGTSTVGDQTSVLSGVYGNLAIYKDVPNGLLNSPSDAEELYYQGTTHRAGVGLVGYINSASSASTEFDYNFSTRIPPPPEGGSPRRSPQVLVAHNPDGNYGNAILEFNLRSSQIPSATWIDRFGISYAEETSLSFDHYEITDSNDENNLVEPGETIRLKAFIRNNSNLPVLSPFIAILKTDNKYVTFSDITSQYSGLTDPKQMSGPNGYGFEFTVSPDCPSNEKIQFTLNIQGQLDTSGLASTAFSPTELEYNCPFIVEVGKLELYDDGPNGGFRPLYDDTISDPSIGLYDNSNGQVNPGEEIRLSLSFWNRSYTETLQACVASFYVLDTPAYVNVMTNTVVLGDIGPRTIIKTPSPFKFGLPSGYFYSQMSCEIVITDGAGNRYTQFFQIPVNKGALTSVPGFPYYTGAPIHSSPTIVDLNKDGITDILVGNDTGYISAISLFIDGAAILPGWPVNIGIPIRNPVSVGDINNSGTNSVVVVPENRKVYAWHQNGAPYGTNGLLADLTPYNAYINAPAVLADLTGSGALNIVLAGTYDATSQELGVVYAINSSGQGLPGWPVLLGGPIVAAPAVGNIQGSDLPEIVVAAQSGEVAGYHADGTRFFYQSAGAGVSSPPVLGDIEGTGQPDIIVKASNGNVWAWRPDGSTVAGFPIFAGGSVVNPPALGDLNGDGNPDILVGTQIRLMVITYNGSSAVVDQEINTGVFTDTQPAIADIDQTSTPEIIVTGSNGSIQVYDNTGNFISFYSNTYQDSSPGVLRFTNPNAVTVGGEAINNAIIVTDRTGNINAYLSLYDSDPGLAYWPQYRHDAMHRGLYAQPPDTFLYATKWTTDNAPYNGIFDYVGDVDWLSFNGIGGHLYRITVTKPAGSTANPQIALYDSGGSSMSAFVFTKIEHTVPSNGTYYVKISNGNSASGSSATYDVQIIDVTATTPVPMELWNNISE